MTTRTLQSPDGDEDGLERDARAAGLERFLELDRAALGRARAAALAYRSRRVVVEALGPEPAHCYRVENDHD